MLQIVASSRCRGLPITNQLRSAKAYSQLLPIAQKLHLTSRAALDHIIKLAMTEVLQKTGTSKLRSMLNNDDGYVVLNVSNGLFPMIWRLGCLQKITW